MIDAVSGSRRRAGTPAADRPLPATRPPLPWWRKVVFAIVPVVMLAVLAEVGVRTLGWDRPAFQSTPLPEELAGIVQTDRELFWSLTPGAATVWRNTRVTVNAHGTRGADIVPRRAGELRILSLGESTTFGVNVSDGETYSARLEARLRQAMPDRPVTVINAGVSAYSSFQSARLLEMRGLAFDPDVILVYHEINDYLPSTLRDASNTEVGVLMTDRELYESRTQRSHRALMDWSAVYRWASYTRARARIREFDRPGGTSPLVTIGLPGYELRPLLQASGDAAAPQNEKALGRRVTDDERRSNLERMLELSRARGIALVLIHPSYRDSTPHECVLTRFAAERGVPLLDAYAPLHPPAVDPRGEFSDAWHPTAPAHARLAAALQAFLEARGLPARR
jgi:lysophospholipase L1-like esterase